MLGAFVPQKRNPENKGYPPRWRVLHGAIYYRVPKGLESKWDGKQLFRLGKTPSEAHRAWADRVEVPVKTNTIGELLDRYLIEIIPKKAPKTQTDYRVYVAKLRPTFGHMPISSITPLDIYTYVDKRAAKVAAKREIALLKHAYTKAVRWGLIEKHPFKGEVRFDEEAEKESPRDRYVENWEINALFSLKPTRKGDFTLAAQAYAHIKILTGMSKGDLLRLNPSRDFKEDGIHIERHKTKKKTKLKTIYEWSNKLRDACDIALAVRPVDISPFLFCKRDGGGYFNEETGRCDGWNSSWHRFMDRLLKETDLKERFTDHDIRAKAGSDADDDEHARKLMSHSSVKMTRRVYRRRPEKVKPL